MSGRWVALAGVAALLVVPALSGCGGADQGPAKKEPTISARLAQCQEQWHDVADSVLGLDEDTDPSALAGRWTTVIATVDYYENSTDSQDCQERIEAQVKAITALRQFSERLRPYDMTFQLRRVSAAVDLYLHDPVPKPVKGPSGKPVKPPTHHQVSEALGVLQDQAAAANAELQPAWSHLVSISLDDDAVVSDALDDLDALAQAGTHWRACQQALQVIIAATRAQEGLLGTPEDQPSRSATPAP